MESSTPFTSSLDVYNWISGFINLERDRAFKSFRLDRLKLMADLAGHPETCAPALHSAGSKGKGSVTGMCAAILNSAGYVCGCYASPHVSDFRERLSLGSVFFDEAVYRQTGEELRNLTHTLLYSGNEVYALFQKERENGEEPTFFELMTLWFFLCSRAAKVRAMAVETGMGGRLDATNIIDPRVSLITVIELEHTDILGNTLAAIAGEKAGIIKPGRPVVVARQKEEALEVFRQRARETQSPLYYFPEWGELGKTRLSREGTFFSLRLKNPLDGGIIDLPDLRLSIPGEIQAENAGLAALAIKTAFPEIPHEAIVKGLETFSLPGRFELILRDPVLIIDGAHTPGSVENCVNTFTRLYGKGGILIFACAAGKDAGAMAALLLPWFSRILITTPGSFKKSDPPGVYETFRSLAPAREAAPEILFIPEPQKALETALELAGDLGLPILGTGSFYLAAELRASKAGL